VGSRRKMQTRGQGTVYYTGSLPGVQQTAVVVKVDVEIRHAGSRIGLLLSRGSQDTVLLLAWPLAAPVLDRHQDWDFSHEELAERVDEGAMVCC